MDTTPVADSNLLYNILTSAEFAAFLVTVALGLAGFLGKALRDFLMKSLSGKQLEILIKVAENAVKVAEQTGLSKTGEEKKQQAIEIAETYLKAYNIKVSAAQLEAAIEAAVFSQITKFEAPQPEPDTIVSGTATP